MQPFLMQHFGNPSSGHVYGRACRAAVQGARRSVAVLLGCDEDEVFFTGCGTESDNCEWRMMMGCFARMTDCREPGGEREGGTGFVKGRGAEGEGVRRTWGGGGGMRGKVGGGGRLLL